MLNCYCRLSSSVIFRQYGVSQSECKIDRPRPLGPDQGFLVSRLVLTLKPWERGCSFPCDYLYLSLQKIPKGPVINNRRGAVGEKGGAIFT
jgi:hypothetical protein